MAGADPELGKGRCTLLKRLKTKKIKIKKISRMSRSRMSEGSSNITMKLKYIIIIIIPIYSFTDKLHCLINTATALLELLLRYLDRL